MYANLLSIIILLPYLRLVAGETTKDSLRDMQSKSTLKSSTDDVSTPDMKDANPTSNLKSPWAYLPPVPQSRKEQETEVHLQSYNSPFALTRLAKSHTFGVDPYFNKGYFEPFERRQRPVTLVAFRKNGWLPKKTVKIEGIENEASPEVAEMQSPFNEVSTFWAGEPWSISE